MCVWVCGGVVVCGGGWLVVHGGCWEDIWFRLLLLVLLVLLLLLLLLVLLLLRLPAFIVDKWLHLTSGFIE